MRRSKRQAAQTRRSIVSAAVSEFGRNGIQSTGLCDLMATIGLTHGGFYGHFRSKGQLVAEACHVGMKSTATMLEVAACLCGHQAGIEAIAATYLSAHHRDNRAGGCPLAGLGSELARAPSDARDAATEGFFELVDIVCRKFPNADPEVAKERAMAVLCAMVGAVTVSRVVTSLEASDAILRNMKRHIVKL